MRLPYRFVLVALAMGLTGCTTPADPALDSTYHYASYDTTGTLLVQGWFTMDLADSDSVSGEWHFTPVGNPQRIGPQTGDGKLIGGFHDTTLWIELQPQFRDNNLELVGKLEGGKFSGTWTWISFIGITNRGRFEAVKQ